MTFKFEIPEAVQKELAERDAKQAKEAQSKVDIISFPNCPPEKQAAPSSLLRSALFGVVRRGKRAYLDNVEIASWQGTSIKYAGARLMQSDQDVWLACVQACSCEGKSDIVISQRGLIKLLGRNVDKKWLISTLTRLVANAVTVKDSRYTYIGSLIHDAIRDQKTGHLALSINPKMLVLFGGNVTHIDITQRHALKMDLAKWLQGYVCSHKSTWKKPHFIGLDKLQALAGSKTTEIRKFRQQLKKAMDQLKAQDVVGGWKLEDDILTLWRPSKVSVSGT